MKTIDPGHLYELSCLSGSHPDRRSGAVEVMRFAKRVGDAYPGNEAEPYDGTNLQETLRVQIDRVKYLDSQLHSKRNLTVIECLKNALFILELRNAEKKGWSIDRLCAAFSTIETVPPCPTCGHLFCPEHRQ